MLKTPLVNIFKAFGLALDDVDILEGDSFALEDNIPARDSPNVSALVGVLQGLPEEQATIVMQWLLANKKDGGPPPPSELPT